MYTFFLLSMTFIFFSIYNSKNMFEIVLRNQFRNKFSLESKFHEFMKINCHVWSVQLLINPFRIKQRVKSKVLLEPKFIFIKDFLILLLKWVNLLSILVLFHQIFLMQWDVLFNILLDSVLLLFFFFFKLLLSNFQFFSLLYLFIKISLHFLFLSLEKLFLILFLLFFFKFFLFHFSLIFLNLIFSFLPSLFADFSFLLIKFLLSSILLLLLSS